MAKGGIRIYSAKTGKAGFSNLYQKFEEYQKVSDRESAEAARETALEIRRDTRKNIRASLTRQSGILERSAYFRKRGNKPPTYEVGVGADYAWFAEFGTGQYNILGEGRNTPWYYKSDSDGLFYRTTGQRANLFFNDAVERNIGRYPDSVRKKMEGGLR